MSSWALAGAYPIPPFDWVVIPEGLRKEQVVADRFSAALNWFKRSNEIRSWCTDCNAVRFNGRLLTSSG